MPAARRARASEMWATPSQVAPAPSAARATGNGTVAVGVGLDHGHHLGRRGHGRQLADVVPDGFEVDHGRAFLGVG